MRYTPVTLFTFASILTASFGLQSRILPARTLGGVSSGASSTQLNVVIGVETAAIAIASAAMGAAARQPEIDSLKQELSIAQAALEESKGEMVKKIELLEDKLFEMDKAYEAQSAKFQKEYEAKKKEEVAKIEEKLKEDFKYKLDIELQREKSKLLSENLEKIKIGADQSAKLAEMRIRQQELEDTKSTLQKAVKSANAELNDLRKEKKGWWQW